MAAYPGRLQEIAEEFASLQEPDLRAELLIEYADSFVEVPSEIATRPFPQANLVPSCESQAYVWCTCLADGGLKFHFAVENPHGISAKALAAILDEGLRGASAEEAARVSEEIVFDIFGRNVSMGRGQGLMAMVSMVRHLARDACSCGA